MKNFIFFLLISAVGMTQGAKYLQRIQAGFRQQQIDVAMGRATEAKATYARDNADNEAALEGYNAASPEERAQTLLDLGLLTDKNALCLVDPGALDEAPKGRTVAEMDRVAHEGRAAEGLTTTTLAMR